MKTADKDSNFSPDTLNSGNDESISPPEKVAVIYVHGMGDQTRLSDPTAILNNLELYWRQHHSKFTLDSKVHEHASTVGNPHYSLYTELPNGSSLDLHEVYWAPDAPDVDAKNVLRWLRKQLFVPFLRLHSQWAELRRLKLGVLGQAVVTEHVVPSEGVQLKESYKRFAQHHLDGTFDDFACDAPGLPQPAADRWHQLTRSNDWTVLWIVLSMILATLGM